MTALTVTQEVQTLTFVAALLSGVWKKNLVQSHAAVISEHLGRFKMQLPALRNLFPL